MLQAVYSHNQVMTDETGEEDRVCINEMDLKFKDFVLIPGLSVVQAVVRL